MIAVVAQATLAFSAAHYLTSHGVPVVGISEDGPERVASKNMFSVSGVLQPTQVTTTAGKFWKAQGVTNLASLGYGISLWMTKLVGQKFELVSGADPVCGSVIPGKTVAAAQ